MLKKVKGSVAFRLAVMLTALSTVMTVTMACLWYFNQPEVPEELLSK
ncbi:cyclic lactone autoinducer peptide [Cohnella sp. REN36]|nr:cyclic lactone autoinducer peptide [Cohnella sp. REN36]MCC3374906.1 cyclic lactone autoinducer peptide [Cohnella sp. REN36]